MKLLRLRGIFCGFKRIIRLDICQHCQFKVRRHHHLDDHWPSRIKRCCHLHGLEHPVRFHRAARRDRPDWSNRPYRPDWSYRSRQHRGRTDRADWPYGTDRRNRSNRTDRSHWSR